MDLKARNGKMKQPTCHVDISIKSFTKLFDNMKTNTSVRTSDDRNFSIHTLNNMNFSYILLYYLIYLYNYLL